MSIEQILERMALASERQAAALEALTAVALGGKATDQALAAPAPIVVADEPKGKSKAELDAEAKAASDAVAAKVKAQEKVEADAKAKAKAFAAATAAEEAAKALEEKAPAPKNSIDDVRRALQAYREIEGGAAMLEVLASFNATNLKELKPESYDAVVAKVS